VTSSLVPALSSSHLGGEKPDSVDEPSISSFFFCPRVKDQTGDKSEYIASAVRKWKTGASEGRLKRIVLCTACPN
jgi:hypothetical protein